MAEKFDPAPHDKHAVDPKEAVRADNEADNELEKGLKDTFPASDPVSLQQPVTTKLDRGNKARSADQQTLWDRVKGAFR